VLQDAVEIDLLHRSDGGGLALAAPGLRSEAVARVWRHTAATIIFTHTTFDPAAARRLALLE
jgi:hypothetical protein